VEKLIFDERCVQSLPMYLTKRRSHVARLGKPAVVVKACDARAIAGMLREFQLKREEVVVIGVRCGGVLHKGAKPPLGAASVHGRCSWCQKREPDLVDHLVGDERPKPPMYEGPDLYGALEKMTHAERFAFWAEQLERCTRCYACRQACPMCYCERCVADKTQPQWIESSPHARGNFAWHITRAMHQAGRCINCGECERACPVDIPLSLLNRKIQNVVAERFGYRVSDDPSVPAPIGTFDKGDPQEFIL
jgi:ferredoxin